jgi:Domain of unknown function (DUF6989)
LYRIGHKSEQLSGERPRDYAPAERILFLEDVYSISEQFVLKREKAPSFLASDPVSFRLDAPLPDLAFLGLFALMALLHVAAALLARGWITAAIADAIVLSYLLGMLSSHREWRPLIARLAALGLVAGVAELATDAAGQQIARSLVYPSEEPMIWQSPLYMPISWMIVLTLLGYLGWRLAGLLPLWHGMALCGLAGTLIVPFYEECAWYAGWWHYTTQPRIGHTPIYVLLFEGGIAAILPLLTRGLKRLPLGWVAARGLLLGAGMPLVAFISWRLLGQG